jgi:sphingolipid delta-4 desaturase
MSSSVSTATVSLPQQTAAGAKTAVPQQKAQEQQQQASKGNKQDEFFWTYTEEPHATRRQAIIKAHPEVHIT